MGTRVLPLRRLTIWVSDESYDRLVALAARDRRHPHAEAGVLIEWVLGFRARPEGLPEREDQDDEP